MEQMDMFGGVPQTPPTPEKKKEDLEAQLLLLNDAYGQGLLNQVEALVGAATRNIIVEASEEERPKIIDATQKVVRDPTYIALLEKIILERNSTPGTTLSGKDKAAQNDK